jgi:hypothetical protein
VGADQEAHPHRRTADRADAAMHGAAGVTRRPSTALSELVRACWVSTQVIDGVRPSP